MVIEPAKLATLNTKRVYVRGTTSNGCHVYLPVDTLDEALQLEIKQNLQLFLDSQPRYVKPVPPTTEPEVA